MANMSGMKDGISKKMIQRMVFVLCVFVFVGFVPIALRLFNIQITQHEFYQAKAIGQQMRDTVIAPKRGTIYDRNMKTLALSASTEVVSIAPKSLKKEEIPLVASELSRILGVSEESILKKASTNTYYQTVKRQVEKETADQIRKFIKDNKISGINLDEDSKRYYPYGSFASHVIGFTNVDGDGLEGIESYYNDILMGTPGRIVSAKNALSTDMPLRYEQYIDAKNGYNLVLTIDEVIQHFTEKHLETAVKTNNVQNRGSAIVMEVNTGEILAMATYPDYDLNAPREISDPLMVELLATLEGKEKSDKQLEYWQANWRNKAIADTYEPGSTFKAVTASIGLEENKVNFTETNYCPGFKMVSGRRISCWKTAGHGALNLAGGLQGSCNPFFMELGARIGGETFYKYVEAYGLLGKTGIDLYGEATGIFHQKSVISKGPVELAVSSFGQTFKVTPIGFITAFSTVVNGGYLVTPHIAGKVVDDNGSVVQVFEPTIKRQVISEETSKAMAEMLETVVTSGTGKNAYVKGYRIGGKTATSEKIDQKNEEGAADKRTVSFIGFAPADDPQVAILIFLDEPQVPGVKPSGGGMVAPAIGKMFADILPYMGIMPSYTEAELASMEKPVPNVSEKPVEDARKLLKDSNFQAVVMGEGTTVLEQVPRPGQKLAKGGKIILYTEAEAGELVSVPNLIEQSLGNARSTLANDGLNIRVNGKDTTDSSLSVIGQNPTAGSMVAKGTVIVVDVVFNAESDWVSVAD